MFADSGSQGGECAGRVGPGAGVRRPIQPLCATHRLTRGVRGPLMAANSGPDLEVKRKEQAAPAAIDGWSCSLQSNSTVESSPMTDRRPSAFLQCLDPDCQRENWSLSWICPNMQNILINVPLTHPFS